MVKRKIMVCCICGKECEEYNAYCSKHCRSPHKIIEIEDINKSK